MFKKPVWEDLSFVTWCIILLEVASEDGYTVVIKGWTWPATILRLTVAFKDAQLVLRGPKCANKISPTPLHQPESLRQGRITRQVKTSGGAAEFSRLWISSAQNCAFMCCFFLTYFLFFYFSFWYVYRLQWLCTTEEHFWTLDSATLTWFRTLYPRIQRGHWRYFGAPSWTMTTWTTAGGEGNTAGDALEYATDWGKGLTALLYQVFCSLMSNPWRIRWTILEPG